MVNGTNYIYVEREGRIEQTHARFISEEHLRRVIDRIVSRSGGASMSRRPWWTLACPTAPASTPSCRRCRWTAPILTIRKFAKDPFQAADLVEMGTFTPRWRRCCRRASRAG